MEIKEYIGKVVQVKIITKKENYYIAKILNSNVKVYIEDTNDYIEEELIDQIEKCIILDEKQRLLNRLSS